LRESKEKAQREKERELKANDRAIAAFTPLASAYPGVKASYLKEVGEVARRQRPEIIDRFLPAAEPT
jgi:hypothetical protein